jgi:hypothetical protein
LKHFLGERLVSLLFVSPGAGFSLSHSHIMFR